MLMLITLLCSVLGAFPTYEVSVFVNLTDNGPNYPKFRPLMNLEGITIGHDKMFVSRYYNGTIYRINPKGSVKSFAQFVNTESIQMTGLKLNGDNIIIAVHDKFENGTYKPYHGVWKIKHSGGVCDTTESGSNDCKKIFPLFGENVSFSDGIEVDNDDNVYVSDPDLGNIWKINLDKYRTTHAQLWAGTDAGSNPNYLQGGGFLFPPGGPFNMYGRGFGANGLSMDKDYKNLYVANAEMASVVKVPVLKNVKAGTQVVLGSNTGTYIYDGIFYDHKKIYVTAVAKITATGLEGGNRIIAADLRQKPITFNVIVNDPLLGTPTDVTTRCDFGSKYDCDDLFITDIAGFGLSQFGPNVLLAKAKKH